MPQIKKLIEQKEENNKENTKQNKAEKSMNIEMNKLKLEEKHRKKIPDQ